MIVHGFGPSTGRLTLGSIPFHIRLPPLYITLLQTIFRSGSQEPQTKTTIHKPSIFAFLLLSYMIREKILVIGASGQIGVELTLALRKIYGAANVIASDLREQNPLLEGTGPYVSLDVMNKEMLHVQVIRQNITQIYLLAAILSATGEKNPG